MSKEIRVRFAPSPTGPLHIGGVRTALYNYVFAKKLQGTFILRIEDTDQFRYVEGAEEYILKALKWMGLKPDESIENPGKHGPYRQSERKEIYREHVDRLIASGHAYYAFDSAEELDEMRKREQENGIHSPKYDQRIRMTMKNSLTCSKEETTEYLDNGTNVTVRMKVPEDEEIQFVDQVRGKVGFHSSELDDKVIMKADGLPTYHLANVVDDKLMEISHVIRGEEWLSSTAHHVLLYRAFGWSKEIPEFAHLPLILKPSGKGKLSKRDGAKFGFPVFPLDWFDTAENTLFSGFKEAGFLPNALLNFISLLGWNPGSNEEIFDMERLCELFSIDGINKSGAQFNYEKARWFNQQYIIATENESLLEMIRPEIEEKHNHHYSDDQLSDIVGLLKPRVEFLTDLVAGAEYFFEAPAVYDDKTLKKRFKTQNAIHFEQIATKIASIENWTSEQISMVIKSYVEQEELKFGEIFSVLRNCLTGHSSGPDLFSIICLIGKEEVDIRIQRGLNYVTKLVVSDA